MSYKRTYGLIALAAISLTAMVAPTQAHATAGSAQYGGGNTASVAGDGLPAASQTEDPVTAGPAWSSPRLDDAAGFTEAAMAYQPDSDAANKPLAESSGHSKIPEPSTLMLFGTVLIGIGYAVRKRTKL